MASLEELKQKLQDEKRSERREVVRKLGQMGDQHNQVVPLLRQQLVVDSDEGVIEECVKALKQLQAFDSEIVSLLQKRLETDSNPDVLRVVIALGGDGNQADEPHLGP